MPILVEFSLMMNILALKQERSFLRYTHNDPLIMRVLCHSYHVVLIDVFDVLQGTSNIVLGLACCRYALLERRPIHYNINHITDS